VAYPGYTEVTRGSGTKSGSVLGGAEADNEGSPASSRLWVPLAPTFFLLGTLLLSPRRYWAEFRNQINKSLGHDTDMEKGLKPAGCLDFLDRSFDETARVGSRPERGESGAVLRRPLVKRVVRMRRSWCENCRKFTGRSQGRCIACDQVGRS